MYGDPLTPLERDAISGFITGGGHGLEAFRPQLEECRIKSRELTGVGFFTQIVVPQRLAVMDVGSGVFDGINAQVEGLPRGAGFLLLIRDGMLEMLEGFVYGDAT